MKNQTENTLMKSMKNSFICLKNYIRRLWKKLDNFLEIVNKGLIESKNRGYGPKS